ncbi:hypothetical protein KC19_10G193500 [Ceratodon purpureus]|nr:hypothetical protein KC19_10G193500 [Ceratodon purpureus]
MEELPLCFGAIHLQDLFTCIPKWLDLQGLDARFRKIKSRMDVFYTNMISQHREERRRNPVSEEHKTLLDVLLEELEKPEQGVTEDNVNGLIWDILAAGTDTTMLTCEWAMAEILRNPTVLEQATSELDQVIGHNRLVQESDIPELKYMQAIVKEVLRLHPVAPMLIPHQNTHLTKAFGYNIPTQTRLFVNVWAMGRDPCVWEEPLEFRPERFLEGGVHGNTKFEGQHFEYLPFGSGRRSCLGLALASIEVHLMVASLVHAFEWSFLDGVDAERLDMTEGESFFVHLRDPLMVVAKSRLPSHLYQC